MSYPAKNTDREFEVLVEAIKDLHEYLRESQDIDLICVAEESEENIKNSFSKRRYEEVFDNDDTI